MAEERGLVENQEHPTGGVVRARDGEAGGAVVLFYRITLRRMANTSSAICKGPSIPSTVTKI
jgi:hypothetical protein